MKPTSVLFGDLADLFQDSRLDDAQIAAEAAQSSANHVGRQVAMLRQRILELERDNALLAVVLSQTIKQLEAAGGMSREEFKASLQEELAQLRAANCDDYLNLFRESLGLPRQRKTDVSLHKPATPQAPRAKVGSVGKPGPRAGK